MKKSRLTLSLIAGLTLISCGIFDSDRNVNVEERLNEAALITLEYGEHGPVNPQILLRHFPLDGVAILAESVRIETGIRVSPNGRYVAYFRANPDNNLPVQALSLYIYDIKTGQELITPVHHERVLWQELMFDWSSDSRYLPVITRIQNTPTETVQGLTFPSKEQDLISLLDVETMELQPVITVVEGMLRSVKISPSGNKMSIVISDYQWGYGTFNDETWTLSDNESTMESLPGIGWPITLPPIYTEAYIVDITSGEIIHKIQNSFLLSGLHWSPGGRLLAYSDTHPEKGQRVLTMRPDGTQLRTVWSDAGAIINRSSEDTLYRIPLLPPLTENLIQWMPNGNELLYAQVNVGWCTGNPSLRWGPRDCRDLHPGTVTRRHEGGWKVLTLSSGHTRSFASGRQLHRNDILLEPGSGLSLFPMRLADAGVNPEWRTQWNPSSPFLFVGDQYGRGFVPTVFSGSMDGAVLVPRVALSE